MGLAPIRLHRYSPFTSTYIEGIDPTIPTFSFIATVIRALVVPVMVPLQFQADLLPSIVLLGSRSSCRSA